MNLVKEFRTVFLLVLVPVLLLAGLYSSYVFSKTPDTGLKDESLFITKEQVAPGDMVVIITPDGFLPKEVTVKQGERVVWLNERGTYAWPASDLHPTHSIYPEFDPLEPVPEGQAWSFIFRKTGEWRYHDHLKPNFRGLVKVVK